MIFLPPEAQTDPYAWLTALLAHGALGLVLVAIVAAVASPVVTRPGWFAVQLVALAYGLVWELGVQHIGAGLADAFVDTFAVAFGGLIGWAAWAHRKAVLALGVLAMGLVAWIGVKARK